MVFFQYNRLKYTMVNISLPDFNGEEFLKCMKKHIYLEKRWVPPIPNFSLYLRPLGISMEVLKLN